MVEEDASLKQICLRNSTRTDYLIPSLFYHILFTFPCRKEIHLNGEINYTYLAFERETKYLFAVKLIIETALMYHIYSQAGIDLNIVPFLNYLVYRSTFDENFSRYTIFIQLF